MTGPKKTACLLVLASAGLGLTASILSLGRSARRSSHASSRTARPSATVSRASVDPPARALAGLNGTLPLAFEANCGQIDSRVKFLSRGNGYRLYLTATEAVLTLERPRARRPIAEEADLTSSPQGAVVTIRPLGGRSEPEVAGLEPLPGRSNYFIGNDPKRWRTDIPHYSRVLYRNVYPGIDLAYHGEQGRLEYDFTVASGADPRRIHLAFEGAERMWVDGGGDLRLRTAAGEIRHQRPVLYQDIGGVRRPIEGGYRLYGSSEVGFDVGAYDFSQPLVIDPVMLRYSTYLGGVALDGALAVAVLAKQAYVTGFTESLDFPLRNAGQPANQGLTDAFVVKFNDTGTALLYSTYLGGSDDENREDLFLGNNVAGIAVNRSGEAYVTGSTCSSDFPTTVRAFQPRPVGGAVNCFFGTDGFVAKLDAAGSLVYSSFLSGSDVDVGNGIAVNAAGEAYVVGTTTSPDFQTVNAYQPFLRGFSNAFLAKVSADGSALLFSTYFGVYLDQGLAIAVKSGGDAYFTGSTISTTFPTNRPPLGVGGAEDAFVARFTGATLFFSVLLGGSGDEVGLSIAVDRTGKPYVTGLTSSTDFPTVRAFQGRFGGGRSDAFVAKLKADGSGLVYSTYAGGSGEENLYDADFGAGLQGFRGAITVSSAGTAFVTGSTTSANFPLFRPIQGSFRGQTDAFVLRLSPAGRRNFSTYLGGREIDVGRGIAWDGRARAAFVTGWTDSASFPTTTGAFQVTSHGSREAFVAKIR